MSTTIATPEEPERPKRRRSRSKRGNGEGSIWPRKDGRYGFAAYVPTTAGTFKRVQGYARSHEEARKKLTKLLEQADQGIPVSSESWTVEEYLAYWLKNVVQVERRPKTYQGYEGAVRRYLIPELGKKRLGKLTVRDVRLAITRIREACQCCRNGWDDVREVPRCCSLKAGECCRSKLSPRMVQFIHAVLRNALQAAVQEEIIPRNVARLVKITPPKYKVNRGLSVDQARDVLKTARGERLYALYALALCLGLRRGELLGLRWQDITFVSCSACGEEDRGHCEQCDGSGIESATLEVIQTLQRVGGALTFVPPKTDDSERTVPLPRICITALCDHKAAQEAERSACPDWQDHGLVFPSRIGTPLEPDNLRRSWGRIREAVGLDSMRFHDMRHTCVSLLLDGMT